MTIKKEPVEEVQEELEENSEKINEDYEEEIDLTSELNTIKFLTDPIRFNAIMYQGMQILMKKVASIEEKLNGKQA